MSELDEIKDRIKEAGNKRQKQKIRKRGKIAIVAAVVVIAILISAYIATPQEKYWKPDKKFNMPEVDWDSISREYTVKRTHFNDINGTIINQTIGGVKEDANFRLKFLVCIHSYIYDPNTYDDLHTRFYIAFDKISGDYRVKEVVFTYTFSDEEVGWKGIDYYYLATDNLYLTADKGNYGGYTYRINYEWEVLHMLRGINKDARNIKHGGLTCNFDPILLDSYPNWTEHNITLTATLYYGSPTILGWMDIHKLSVSAVIHIVPEEKNEKIF